MPEDKGIFKCLKCDYVTVFKTEFVSHYEKVHFHTRNYTLKKQKRQERALNRENRILDHKLKKGSAFQNDSNAGATSLETKVNLELSNERFGKPKDTCFKILVGSFYDCIIPEDVESLWGPIPLQKLPRGVDNTCRAVTHG